MKLGRRAVLRGALGTVIGLPLLERMLRSDGEALADGSPLPCRFVVFQCPTSLVTSNGGTDGLTPTRAGFGYDIRPVLTPLSERGIAGDVSVVSGLFVPPLEAPGGYNVDFHGQATFAIFTGRRSGFTGGDDWLPQGMSADQIVAQTLGASTMHRSLYFQIDPDPGGDMGVSYEPTRDGFQEVEAELSPALAYRRLVTGVMPSMPMVDPNAELERRLRLSSLSYARDDIRRLQTRLGAADRHTLDEHLTRIRELEVRLSGTLPTGTGSACEDPGHPAIDPPELAPGVPDQERRARLFVELIELALACDLTRVAVLGSACRLTGAGMRHERWNEIGGLHADVQHEGSQAELDAANTWFVDVYADLVARIKAIPAGAGSVLDHTAALFVMEGGRGTSDDARRSGDGGGDPNHSVDNAVMMVAGRAGGLRAGQHIDISGRDLHHALVFNSAMRAVGVTETLGEFDQSLDELFEG